MSAHATHHHRGLMKLTSVFLTLICASLCLANHLKPAGIITRHSNAFLTLLHGDYFKGEPFKEKLQNATIPDQVGSFPSIFWSTVNYNVTKIDLISFATPEVELSMKPTNSTLHVFVPDMIFNAEHEVELTTGNWTISKDSGYITITLIDVELTMPREVVISEENKAEVKYISRNCTAVIKDIFLNYATNSESDDILCLIDNEELKRHVADLLCSAALNVTDYVISFDEYDPNENYFLNMTLVEDPVIRDDSRVEYSHVGRIQHTNDTGPFTSLPETSILPLNVSDEMVTIAISNFTLNSLGKMIQDKQLLKYRFTTDDLDEDFEHLLNMTCAHVDGCLGSLLSNASQLYENKVAEIAVSTLRQPVVQIGPNKSLEIEIDFNFEIKVRTSKDSTETLFTFELKVSANAHPSLKGNSFVFVLARPVNTVFTAVGNSTIGQISKESMERIASMSLLKNVLPLICDLETDGFVVTSAVNYPVDKIDYTYAQDALWIVMNVTADHLVVSGLGIDD